MQTIKFSSVSEKQDHEFQDFFHVTCFPCNEMNTSNVIKLDLPTSLQEHMEDEWETGNFTVRSKLFTVICFSQPACLLFENAFDLYLS